MRRSQSIFWLCTTLIGLSSCREDLVNSADAEKERRIIGVWDLAGSNPPVSGHVQFTFRPDLTVRVIYVDPDTTLNYDVELRFLIENGFIYYYESSDDLRGINEIESLGESDMVLRITSGGITIRQFYHRLP